ncbi:hypothetical protein DAEQUDRAFT_185349 [Daedalea quercina L-15889]|uniref:Uncharacterized protein n=1 Tax=Daedalea quercina L-15889 TaxID=1314783 RepID=A0A165KI50_9APHY|nr:hypothetical protein DAEQUDRAFT_185349 [Daedalea quercina L-15889]
MAAPNVFTPDIDQPMIDVQAQLSGDTVTATVTTNIAQAPMLWRYREDLDVCAHINGQCDKCDGFVGHIVAALSTRSYQTARVEQIEANARRMRREAYEQGFQDAQQDTAALNLVIQQLQTQIAELEAQQTAGHVQGGGGFGPIRNRPTRRTHERPARVQSLVLTDQPLSYDEVYSAITRSQVDDAVGLSAVHQLQKWRRNIYAALGAGRPLSDYQSTLHTHWAGLPDWYNRRAPHRTPTTQPVATSARTQDRGEAPPRYTDPPEKWVSFYSRYTGAPLPRGLIRDANGRVPLERAETHLMMIGIASPTTPLRRPHKTRVLDALAALFVEPQVYDTHLNAANIVPAATVNITPIPESQEPGAANILPTSMSVIAQHAARCGITREFVRDRLRAWARDYIASGSRPADQGLTATGTPLNTHTDAMGQPATGQGSQIMPNVGGDGEAMAVEPLGRDST